MHGKAIRHILRVVPDMTDCLRLVASCQEAWSKTNTDEHSVVIVLTMPQEAHVVYGAPAKVFITLGFATASASITADLRWIDKQWTRLPEASMLMLPISRCTRGSTHSWEVDKLGSWVDAADAVDGGASHLHAVGDGGARRKCGPASVVVHASALDSALFSVGRASPFPTPLAPLSAAEASGILTAVLHDNIWDVNYPTWYPYLAEDTSERFRFRVWWAGA
jgi:hypothetical protein